MHNLTTYFIMTGSFDTKKLLFRAEMALTSQTDRADIPLERTKELYRLVQRQFPRSCR